MSSHNLQFIRRLNSWFKDQRYRKLTFLLENFRSHMSKEAARSLRTLKSSFEDQHYWKFLSFILIVGAIAAIFATDLEDPLFAGWNIPLERLDPPTSSEYGVKAALLAIVSSAIILLNSVFSSAREKSVNTDSWLTLAGTVTAFFVGYFWLMNETEGNPIPYLLAFAPLTALYVLAFALLFYSRYALHKDVKANRFAFDRATFLIFPGLLGLFGLTIFLLMWLPERVF